MPNMLIISPTNNGKTMIVEKFRRSHLPYESDDGKYEVIPVLMVQMPSDPTIQRFYAAIITALGSPVTRYPSTTRYETMALQLLSATKTKILINIHAIIVISEIHQVGIGSTSTYISKKIDPIILKSVVYLPSYRVIVHTT